MHRAPSLAVLTAAAALALAGCSTAEESAQTTPSPAATSASPSEAAPATSAPAPSEAAPAPAAKSGYITYDEYNADKAAYSQGDVVLFFHASWCPTCQRAEKNLEADPAAIPTDLTIVKVDYDSSSEMKQQYGVTVQHTFVQVDESGTQLTKWTGSNTADEISNKLV
jgi:thioredoxin 1